MRVHAIRGIYDTCRQNLLGRCIYRRALFMCVAFLAVSVVACKSAQGGGLKTSEAINANLSSAVEDLDDAESEVDESDATPEQKAKIKTKIQSGKQKVESQKPAVSELGKTSDTNFQITEEQKADIARLQVYRAIVWTAGIVAGLIGLFFAYRFIRSKFL